MIKFYHGNKGFTLEKSFDFVLSKWNKKQIDYILQHHLKKNDDLEQRFERKINDGNSFNNHINNIKERIKNFKDRNHKSKMRHKTYKTLNTILESLYSIFILGATSTSIILSLTCVGLIVLPMSAGIACTLSLGKKALDKIIINKNNKYKNQHEKDQKSIKPFDKLYRKSLQGNIIDKNENESLCNFFTKYLDETRNKFFFINMNTKIKLNFFSPRN